MKRETERVASQTELAAGYCHFAGCDGDGKMWGGNTSDFLTLLRYDCEEADGHAAALSKEAGR